MTGGDEHSGQAELTSWARDARVRFAAYAAQAVQAAESAAAIRDQVDRTIQRMTERNPLHTEPLHAISVTAAQRRAVIAARKRDFFRAARAGGRLLPEPQNEPEATVVSELEIYLRDMAIVRERDRIAGELLDNIIHRVFGAGLTLDGAAGLTTEPEIRRRIEAAAADLDEVIRVIRDTIFHPADPPGSHEPGGGR